MQDKDGATVTPKRQPRQPWHPWSQWAQNLQAIARARVRQAPAFHIYKRQPLFFLCELEGGAPATSIETEGVGFFAEDEIPPLSLSRTAPAQIARFFEHYRHPEWATDFD